MIQLQTSVLAKLPAHQGAIYALHFCPQENIFFSGSGDGTVIRWDADKLDEATLVSRVNANIYSLLFLPEKELLLIGQLQGGLHVVDLAIKKEIRHLAFHKKGIFDIRVWHDKIFLAGGDGVLSIWNAADFSPEGAVHLSSESIRSIDFHPFNNEIAIATSDHSIYILDEHTLSVKQKITGHKNSVFKVKYSPDGLRLLSGSRDAHLAVWETGSGYAQEQFIPAHNYTINDIAFSQDGKLIATASRDKSIKIWDASDVSFLKKLDATSGGHVNSVNGIFWKGDRLFSGSDDRSVIVWEIRSH